MKGPPGDLIRYFGPCAKKKGERECRALQHRILVDACIPYETRKKKKGEKEKEKKGEGTMLAAVWMIDLKRKGGKGEKGKRRNRAESDGSLLRVAPFYLTVGMSSYLLKKKKRKKREGGTGRLRQSSADLSEIIFFRRGEREGG